MGNKYLLVSLVVVLSFRLDSVFDAIQQRLLPVDGASSLLDPGSSPLVTLLGISAEGSENPFEAVVLLMLCASTRPLPCLAGRVLRFATHRPWAPASGTDKTSWFKRSTAHITVRECQGVDFMVQEFRLSGSGFLDSLSQCQKGPVSLELNHSDSLVTLTASLWGDLL